MACTNLGGAIVCSSPSTEYRRILRCPSCRKRRRFLVRFGGWYGDTLTCCGCARSWADGYQYPFTRSEAKRRRLREDAAERWKTARPASELRDAVREFCETYVGRP